MSAEKSYRPHYSSQDLLRYWQGELNEKEMHALEQAALEDPFLSDAMEGMKLAVEKDRGNSLPEDLVYLREQLEKRVSGKGGSRLLLFGWWKAAAVILVLLVSASLVYIARWKPAAHPSAVAVNQEKAASTPKDEMATPRPPAAGTADSTVKEARNANSKSPSEESKNSGKSTHPSAAQVRNGNTAKQIIARKDEPAVSSPSTTDSGVSYLSPANNRAASLERSSRVAPALQRKAEKPAAAKPSPDLVLVETARLSDSLSRNTITQKDQFGIVRGNESPTQTEKLNLFQGKVVNESNLPLANALVLTRANGNLTYTDKYGIFRLSSPDSLLDVDVSRSGYHTKQFRLRSDRSDATLQLNTSSAGDARAAALSYAAIQRTNMQHSIKENEKINQEAMPADGWISYGEYLLANRKSLPNEKPGEVILIFHVDRKGRLSDFEISQSLSSDQDEEALRLVREGPPWVTRGKRMGTVTLHIPFGSPKVKKTGQ